MSQQAYNVQTDIGWKNIMRGRFATTWLTVIQTELDNTTKTTRTHEKPLKSPDLWGRRIFHKCWKQISKMWVGRNSYVQMLETNFKNVGWPQ